MMTIRQTIPRRNLLAGLGAAGAGLALPAEAATPDGGPKHSVARGPSIIDFGAVGDGVTDDASAIQDALDWAGRSPGSALHVPARMFAIGRPLLIPEDIELAGELPGSGNRPLCGFCALPNFHSDLQQTYISDGRTKTLDVAALLICQEWTRNEDFAGRLHIRDLFFDVDGLTDARGAPIHGLLLSNQQLDLHNVWIRHPTGFGVWINTQRPDGRFVRPIVDNLLRRVWVRGAGVGGATFDNPDGLHPYGGFQIGALPGTRDPDRNAEPAIATDGVLDYCTVAVGPEDGLGCRGDAIHITQAAGWRVSGCHINGAGRHGIRLRKAYQTEISGNYVDGWGIDAPKKHGPFGGIWCTSMMSLGSGVDGGVLVNANRLRSRPARVTEGNSFAAIGLRAGATGTPRGIVSGNVISRRHDMEHAVTAFDFGRSGDGHLEAVVTGNAVSGVAALFLRPWDPVAVRPSFSGNDFQYVSSPPATGWYPPGLRLDNSAPQPGGWSGWIAISAGDPAAWKGVGRIEE